jgi:hypothetical protein
MQTTSLTVLLVLGARIQYAEGNTVDSAEIWVDPVHGHDNNETNCGKAHPCKTLRFAVNEAAVLVSKHCVIVLANGSYLGECSKLGILVHQPMAVVCEAAGECVIDCEFNGRLFNVSKQNVHMPTPSLNMTDISVVNGHTTTANSGGTAVLQVRAALSLSIAATLATTEPPTLIAQIQ